MQLIAADINGEDQARAVGEQHFGEAAGRSADIEADMVLDLDRISLQRAGQLDAAARHVGMPGLSLERSAYRNRFGDFRHRLAVQTLLNWYRKGDDAQRRMPILSTFLGHAQVTDTYWYLTGTPRLLRAAAKRLEKRWEGLNADR